jgi:hypothetical protein
MWHRGTHDMQWKCFRQLGMRRHKSVISFLLFPISWGIIRSDRRASSTAYLSAFRIPATIVTRAGAIVYRMTVTGRRPTSKLGHLPLSGCRSCWIAIVIAIASSDEEPRYHTSDDEYEKGYADTNAGFGT